MYTLSGKYFKTVPAVTAVLFWSMLFFFLLRGGFTPAPEYGNAKTLPGNGSIQTFVRQGFLFSAERSPESNVLSQLLRKRFFRYNFSKRKHQFSSGDPAPDPAAALPDPKRNFYEQKTDRTHLFSSNLAQLRSNTPVRAGPLKSFRI